MVQNPSSADRLNRPKAWHLSILLAATVALLLGMGLYTRGFARQFEPDEVLLFRRHVIYTADTSNLRDPYPPLRIAEMALEYHMLNLVTPSQVDQPIYYLCKRYFSVLYGVLLLAASYQAGRHLHSHAAGLAAMVFMIAQPEAIYYAWLLGMITLRLAFRSITRQSRRWRR